MVLFFIFLVDLLCKNALGKFDDRTHVNLGYLGGLFASSSLSIIGCDLKIDHRQAKGDLKKMQTELPQLKQEYQ